MAPKKITNKSRNVGSRKPGRPPKAKTPEIPLTPAPDWSESNSEIDWSRETDRGMGTITLPGISPTTDKSAATQTRTIAQPIIYTGIEQVAHGLTFPTFDPNSYFPTNIFDDTSPLEAISKAEADVKVHSIEGKRQRMRIVLANQGLMQDIIKGGMEHRKIEGLAIDFDKLKIDNHTKFVNHQTAGLNRDIAVNKWQQTNERLIQGQMTLAGMQSITPLITDEWEARKQLKLSSIADLKTKALRGSSEMDARLTATIDTISANNYDE